MSHITLGQAAQWCGGRVEEQYRDVEFFGASNDTRNIQKGQLFLALKGARDGHDFIPAAMEKGAAAVLCNHCEGDYPALIVDDVRVIDEVIGVSEADALAAVHELAVTEGLFVGISSGAALYAARSVAMRPEYKGKIVVVLLPDGGERYLSTMSL